MCWCSMKGPFGVLYRLKHLDWWAYWAEPKPKWTHQANRIGAAIAQCRAV